MWNVDHILWADRVYPLTYFIPTDLPPRKYHHEIQLPSCLGIPVMQDREVDTPRSSYYKT